MVIRTPVFFPSSSVLSKATRGAFAGDFIGSVPQPRPSMLPTVWMTPGTKFSSSSVPNTFASVTGSRRPQVSMQPPDLSTAGRRSQSVATPFTDIQTSDDLESRSVTSPASQIYSSHVLTPILGLFTPIGIVQAGGKKRCNLGRLFYSKFASEADPIITQGGQHLAVYHQLTRSGGRSLK